MSAADGGQEAHRKWASSHSQPPARSHKIVAGIARRWALRFVPVDFFRKQPEAYGLDESRQVIDVNLTCAFLGSRAVYPHVVKGGDGKIINIDGAHAREALGHADGFCRYHRFPGAAPRIS